jgi:hypothetical protein
MKNGKLMMRFINRPVFVLDTLKRVWKFWKLLKILNRLWTDSEHYWKFWTNSINSEQILNITEKSEQILNITQNCEQILNITENSEQILNMDWSNKYQFYSLWFDSMTGCFTCDPILILR